MPINWNYIRTAQNFTELDINQRKVALKKFADGARQASSYQLVVYKDLDMAKSKLISISFKFDTI